MLSSESFPALKLRAVWLAVGYSLIAVIVILSLTSSPIDTGLDFPYQDKLYHMLAYFSLMFWFAQIYHDRIKRNLMAVMFILMGVLLEYLQGFDPNRYSEFADMLANSMGVLLGLLLALTGAKNFLLKFERIFH
ncbi:MAG: VanZ family protein [Gammaproteobacteria bacterium]|nr:VanZ family protein [Gammaproteobacteria bacterium]NNJ49933.1 VanZ family protein [Gammaproteobacteria bacterium]